LQKSFVVSRFTGFSACLTTPKRDGIAASDYPVFGGYISPCYTRTNLHFPLMLMLYYPAGVVKEATKESEII
jgi:hypothetical protein